MLKPMVCEFITSVIGEGDYDFAQVQVADHPHLVGKSLADLNLPQATETIVISIISADGEQEFNPRAHRQLTDGDTLSVVCLENGLKRIAKLGQ